MVVLIQCFREIGQDLQEESRIDRRLALGDGERFAKVLFRGRPFIPASM